MAAMSAVSTYFRLLNNTTENALFFDVEYEIAASTPLQHYLEQKDVRKLVGGEADLEDPPFLFTNHAIKPDESMTIWQMALDRMQRPLLTQPAYSSASSASRSAPVAPSANISEVAQTSSTGLS